MRLLPLQAEYQAAQAAHAAGFAAGMRTGQGAGSRSRAASAGVQAGGSAAGTVALLQGMVAQGSRTIALEARFPSLVFVTRPCTAVVCLSGAVLQENALFVHPFVVDMGLLDGVRDALLLQGCRFCLRRPLHPRRLKLLFMRRRPTSSP